MHHLNPLRSRLVKDVDQLDQTGLAVAASFLDSGKSTSRMWNVELISPKGERQLTIERDCQKERKT